jgi:hypothetical protein
VSARKPDAPGTALVVARPQALSRRGVLGGALAAAVALVVGGERVRQKPGPNRWNGRTRWIGHC